LNWGVEIYLPYDGVLVFRMIGELGDVGAVRVVELF